MGLIYWYSGSATTEKLEYYQVIELFDEGMVTEYELNIGTGALTYTLDDGSTGRYSVPNVSMFVNDVHETIINIIKQILKIKLNLTTFQVLHIQCGFRLCQLFFALSLQ